MGRSFLTNGLKRGQYKFQLIECKPLSLLPASVAGQFLVTLISEKSVSGLIQNTNSKRLAKDFSHGPFRQGLHGWMFLSSPLCLTASCYRWFSVNGDGGLLWNFCRPDPVFDCFQKRESRFFFETTT